MTNSLVTGGSGFIGRHLVRTLVAQGDAVRVLDLAPPRRRVSGVEYVIGSITDGAIVRDVMGNIDHVYHLAGISHIWTRRAQDFQSINYEGTRTVLAAAQQCGVTRFLHCSSETVRPERSVDAMPGPYSRSKYLAEQAAALAATKGLPVVIVAPIVTLGPDDDNLTPGTAMLAGFLSRRLHFYLNCTLNLVDVRDVAAGIAQACRFGPVGERYFLGGTNISLAELLPMIERITHRKRLRIPIPSALAMLTAGLAQAAAEHLTHRPPIAPVEGVRLARILGPIASDKTQRELGYETRLLQTTLEDAICWLQRGGLLGNPTPVIRAGAA